MSDAAIVAGASVLLALAFVFISWRFPTVVAAPTAAAALTPEDPDTGLQEGQTVRVEADAHEQSSAVVGYFPDVVDDGYIYAEVVNPSPDHEGDVHLQTDRGDHSMFVPADVIEIPPTD